MATQIDPKWSKGCPSGPNKKPKVDPRRPVARYSKEINKPQKHRPVHKMYPHSRCTALQRPASDTSNNITTSTLHKNSNNITNHNNILGTSIAPVLHVTYVYTYMCAQVCMYMYIYIYLCMYDSSSYIIAILSIRIYVASQI